VLGEGVRAPRVNAAHARLRAVDGKRGELAYLVRVRVGVRVGGGVRVRVRVGVGVGVRVRVRVRVRARDRAMG
jgi:hypothetical protein